MIDSNIDLGRQGSFKIMIAFVAKMLYAMRNPISISNNCLVELDDLIFQLEIEILFRRQFIHVFKGATIKLTFK